MKKALLTIFSVLIVDQVLKIYIKLNYYLGQETPVLGDWFKLSFLENKGMAFGSELPFDNAKLILSLFRIVAVAFLAYYLSTIIKKKEHSGYIISIALIFAGALGNIIDSTFYGVLFEQSIRFGDTAKFFTHPEFQGGYEAFLHGNVVDMLYFPMFSGTYPSWFPSIGGDSFLFFSPVFNVADTAISFGVGIILVFQKRFFPNS